MGIMITLIGLLGLSSYVKCSTLCLAHSKHSNAIVFGVYYQKEVPVYIERW